MRKFLYITVGRIIEEINLEIKKVKKMQKNHDDLHFLTRATYYALEKRLKFPKAKRTTGKIRWRVYSASESRIIKHKILKEYNLL